MSKGSILIKRIRTSNNPEDSLIFGKICRNGQPLNVNLPNDIKAINRLMVTIPRTENQEEKIAGYMSFVFMGKTRNIIADYPVKTGQRKFNCDSIPSYEELQPNSSVKISYKDTGLISESYELRIYFLHQ